MRIHVAHPNTTTYIPIQVFSGGRCVGSSVGRRVLHKLTARQVAQFAVPGYYGDGGGLWLQVSPTGSKSWIFRYRFAGKAREMGLGPLHTVSLADARERALVQRKLVLDGVDPIESRKAERRTAVSNAVRAVTFRKEAEDYIESHRAGWKNAKHADQWTATLQTYAYPHIGTLLVSEIDTDAVMRCLQPIWTTKTETASRVRGRIEAVLDYATAMKHRTGDNPARWRGHLDHLLPRPTKVTKTEHHSALPYAEAPAFMKELRAQPVLSARALEFTILTATRTGESIGARWAEVDLDAAEWVIPANRMKAGVQHRVPLSSHAVRVLKGLQGLDEHHVFPGAKTGKPLSNMAMLELLQGRRLGRTDLTVHGFRSTFRDWAAETTNFPNEVVEMALAHTIKDEVEAAYRRGDLFAKRAKLMQAWGDYCTREVGAANVTEFRKENRAGR